MHCLYWCCLACLPWPAWRLVWALPGLTMPPSLLLRVMSRVRRPTPATVASRKATATPRCLGPRMPRATPTSPLPPAMALFPPTLGSPLSPMRLRRAIPTSLRRLRLASLPSLIFLQRLTTPLVQVPTSLLPRATGSLPVRTSPLRETAAPLTSPPRRMTPQTSLPATPRLTLLPLLPPLSL